MIVAPGRLLHRKDHEGCGSYGWQAMIRYVTRPGYRTRFFADSRWGGKEGARLRAELWLTNGGKNV